ncbi:pilus assembly FimT family protein [Myxosarcina sp. GI1(2024)]
MSFHSVRKRNTGFTLIEMIVTAIVVGVIAAIASPNLLGLLNRNRVNSALGEVEGAIKEAQRQAIRNGNTCTVNIDDSSDGIQDDDGVFGGCLLSNRDLDENVRLNSNVTTVSFSHKGTTNTSAVLVVSMANGTNQQRCMVVSPGIGIMRTGDYTGDPTGTLDENNCDSI